MRRTNRVSGLGHLRSLLIVYGLVLSRLPSPIAAQEPVEALLSGQALLGTEPFSGAMVVLHRVTADEAGELDSIPSGSDGSFELLLPHVPDPENLGEVFFASVRHRGILYFGPPINRAVQLDSAYLIQAYDTVAAPLGGADMPIRVRNLFIEGDATGWHATDLIQIGNASQKTVVPVEADVAWAYPLPTGATAFELGQGDFSPEQVLFREGRVEVSAPLPPGDRLLVIRYQLEGLGTAVSMPGRTERAEVLIREPAPPLTVSGLEQVASVELEPGQTYRRYLGAELSGAMVLIATADEERRFPLEWLAVLLSFVLAVVAIVAFRGKHARLAGPAGALQPRLSRSAEPRPEQDERVPQQDERARILLEIARLDESRNDVEGDSSSEQDPSAERESRRADLDRRRAELVARLRDGGRT